MASRRKAFAAIEYPPNCRELSDDLTKDELVKRLKMLALAFQKMGQEDAHSQYAPLALHLASDVFLQHSCSDVKLLVSCCIADVFRIFAPDAPYTDTAQLKEIFLFLARQLSGLRNVDSPYFKRFFYLLENLALVKSFNICLELEDNQEVMTSLLKTIFDIISEEHTAKVKNYFLDIMASLVTEADTLSVEVLDSILGNLVPKKKEKELPNKAAYDLATDLIRRTSKALEPHISRFFNNILVLGKVSESNLSTKTLDVIQKLHHIAPNLLATVMPQLEFKLKSISEEERKNVVEVLASMFSEPSSNLIANNDPLWQGFLGRFNDIHPEVRMKCVECSDGLLINQPSSKKDVACELAIRLRDTDDNIRLKAVSVIITSAKRGLEFVNDQLLSLVKERCLDRKPRIRFEALAGLAALHTKYAREPSLDEKDNGRSNHDAASSDVAWMQDCILHAYYSPSAEDKLEVERLLRTELVPSSLAPQEHVRRMLRLYATVDENSAKALHEILKCQSIMRKQTRDWLEATSGSHMTDQLQQSQAVQLKCAYLARCLPDAAKAADELRTFATTISGNEQVRQLIQHLLSVHCQCIEAERVVKQILQLVRAQDGSHGHSSIKYLLDRVAPWFVDRDVATELVDLVADNDVAANLRRCAMAARSALSNVTNAAETGPKLLVALTTFFPELFDSETVLVQLVDYLKHSDDTISDATLRAIINIGCQVKTTYPALYESMLPALLNFARTGTAKQTKHALLCISTISSPAVRTELFSTIFEHAKKCLNSGSAHGLTAVIAIGYMAALCPDAPYAGELKAVVSEIFVKRILMQDKGVGRKVNDEWYADHHVTEETNCKIAAMKAIVRWLSALKDKAADSASSVSHVLSTLRMLHTVITHNGDLMGKGNVNKPEMSRLRLEAGCCMLRIARQSVYADMVTNQQFQALSLLINDTCYEVRLRFTMKLQKYLLLFKLPLSYIAILSLAANDPVKERRVQVKNFIDTNIQKRRKYIKTHPPSSNAALFHMLPDYVLPYMVHLLAHDPDLKSHDCVSALRNIKECMWSIMEPLVRDQSSLLSLHRKIFERIKQTKDNQNPGDSEANKKLYAVCDLGLVLLQEKVPLSAAATDDNSDPLLPAKLFTAVDKNFDNWDVYLPKEVLMAPAKADKVKALRKVAAGGATSGGKVSSADSSDHSLALSDTSRDGSAHHAAAAAAASDAESAHASDDEASDKGPATSSRRSQLKHGSAADVAPSSESEKAAPCTAEPGRAAKTRKREKVEAEQSRDKYDADLATPSKAKVKRKPSGTTEADDTGSSVAETDKNGSPASTPAQQNGRPRANSRRGGGCRGGRAAVTTDVVGEDTVDSDSSEAKPGRRGKAGGIRGRGTGRAGKPAASAGCSRSASSPSSAASSETREPATMAEKENRRRSVGRPRSGLPLPESVAVDPSTSEAAGRADVSAARGRRQKREADIDDDDDDESISSRRKSMKSAAKPTPSRVATSKRVVAAQVHQKRDVIARAKRKGQVK